MVPIYISTIHPGEIKVFNFNVETVYENYPQGVGKRSAELDGAPKFSLKGTVLSSALCFGKNLYNAYEEHDDFELEDFEEAGSEALDKFVEGTIWTAIKFGIQILFPVTIPFIQAYDIACLVMQGADLLGQLLGMGHAELAILFGEFYDPNDKAGPTGFGEEGYITDNRPYQYTIYFENVDTATLPVPIVEVVDTLDLDLNWSTLEFGESKHKLTSMELDTAGDYGIVTFTFEDIDLPPNINPPEGQSWFTYTIWPESGLASGAQITNQAAIIFRDSLGANEPILTSVVLNTIDNVPPQSSIKILPSTVDHMAFKVSWSGTDDQSGIYQYNVYVSENGGDYDLWLNTEDTSAIYIGKNGNTYTFYSVAIDNVGFMEARPDAPDAVTTIEAQEDIGVNPNPFVPSRGHTVITFFGGSLPNSKIKIYNKAGRLVRTLYETEGESTLEWDATNDDGKKLASGVYIWVLSGPAGKDKGKFAIIR